VRNLVCVGTDPARIAILDNFCWPSCKDPRNLGSLVRAAEACYDGAKAFRTPFISGKDSLNNQFVTENGTTIQIPPTLLISGFGIVPDTQQCVTMDAKSAGSALVLIGATHGRLGGSHFALLTGSQGGELPITDLTVAPKTAHAIHAAMRAGLVRSAHDLSEGGLLVAAAEMAFAGGVGLEIEPANAPGPATSLVAKCFAEEPSRYLVEIASNDLAALQKLLSGIPHSVVGHFVTKPVFVIKGADEQIEIPLDRLRERWSTDTVQG